MALIIISIVALEWYLKYHKTKFLSQANETLSERLHGTVEIKDLTIHIWKTFPQIELSLDGLTVKDSLQQKPAINIQKAATRIGLLSILGNEIKINTIYLSNGYIHLYTDSTGYNNRYLFAPKKEKKSKKQVDIDKADLKNITLLIENKIKNKSFEVLFSQASFKINKQTNIYNIHLKENATIKGLGFNLSKGYYFKDKNISASWHLKFDTKTKELSFPKTRVNIDGQAFQLQGAFNFKDSANNSFRLIADIPNADFAKTKEILQASTQKALHKFKLEKPINIHAQLSGTLAYGSIPLVEATFNTTNNTLTTPIATFNKCNFQGKFTNEKLKGIPRTDENSQASLSNFNAEWANIPFTAEHVSFQNFKKPWLNFNLKSNCNLKILDDYLNLQSVQLLKGNASTAILYDGPYTANEDLLRYVNGSIQLHDAAIKYLPRDISLSNCTGSILLANNTLELKQCTYNIINTRFSSTAVIKDISRLLSDDPEKATISFNLSTPLLNISDFKTLFKPQKGNKIVRKTQAQQFSSITTSIDNILENGNIDLNLNADEIRSNRFTASDGKGNVFFTKNNWKISNATLRHAGGLLQLNGDVAQSLNKQYSAAFSVSVKSVDVKKLFYAFNNFGQSGITHNNLEGSFNAVADIKMNIDELGAFVPNSFNGKLHFSLKNGALINHQPVQRIQQFALKDRDLTNIQFDEIKDTLLIRNGNIYIQPMEIRSTAATIYLAGIYSMNGNETDISIQIPLANFIGKNAPPSMSETKTKRIPSVFLRARPDMKGNMKIGLDVFKRLRDRKKEKTNN